MNKTVAVNYNRISFLVVSVFVSININIAGIKNQRILTEIDNARRVWFAFGVLGNALIGIEVQHIRAEIPFSAQGSGFTIKTIKSKSIVFVKSKLLVKRATNVNRIRFYQHLIKVGKTLR